MAQPSPTGNTGLLFKDEKCAFLVGRKLNEIIPPQAEKLLNSGSRAIPATDPDHFRWVSKEEASLVKVCVLGDDDKAFLDSVLPHRFVARLGQADVSHVLRSWILLLKRVEQTMREILIEEQFHRAGSETSLRSRSAANSRQARISSRVRSGKSLRMSASLMPEARYSRTSYTVMRSPRIQGFPPRLPGSIVMRF